MRRRGAGSIVGECRGRREGEGLNMDMADPDDVRICGALRSLRGNRAWKRGLVGSLILLVKWGVVLRFSAHNAQHWEFLTT